MPSDKPTTPSPVSSLYSSIATLPFPTSALVFPTTFGGRVIVASSIRDLTRNTRRKIFTELRVSDDGKTVDEGFSTEVADGIALIAGLKDGKRWVVLRTTDDKDKGKKRFVEIWRSGIVVKSIDVTESHADFYADETFGSISLSSDETTVAYVAERKAADEKGPEKFMFKPDWGEKFTKKPPPCIAICDLETEEVSIMKEQENLAVGQVQFGPDDKTLVFWGVKTHPRQYGIVFCPNRVSGIYTSDLKGDSLTRLSAEDEAARSPRLDEDRKTVFYISNPIGGPHFPCGRIKSYSFTSKKTQTVLPEVVRAEPDAFPGLFVDRLPSDTVVGSGDAQWIITHSGWRSRKSIIAVLASTGKVVNLTPDVGSGSWGVLAVKANWVVAVRSEPGVPPEVHIGALKPSATMISIDFHPAHIPSSPITPVKWRTMSFPSRSDILEAIIVSPARSQSGTLLKGQRPPLLVFPHGGPHSAFTTEFSVYNHCLAQLGVTLAMVNYRGSTNYGKEGVECLIGKVGDVDIEDTQFVAEYMRKSGEVDVDRVAIWGGSHGGYVSAFLVGKYPDYYKACILRNPVINMGQVLAQSDIPDWAMAESGIKYDLNKPPIVTPEMYSTLYEKSPMSVASNVKTPSLVMLGVEDRRVPNYEGLNWYYYLKGKGDVDVRAMMFDGNGHALDGVEAEKMGFEALGKFLIEFIGEREDGSETE